MSESSSLELLADASVDARRVLALVRPRSLRTESGRVVDSRVIAENLVAQTVLAHAVIPGTKLFRCRVCRGGFAQGKKGEVCAACRRQIAKRKFVCAKCGGAKKTNRSATCRTCIKADRAKKKAERAAGFKCADCQVPIGAKSKRCLSCMSRNREANWTPEQRAARSEAARRQLTPEQRKDLARRGGAASQRTRTREERLAHMRRCHDARGPSRLDMIVEIVREAGQPCTVEFIRQQLVERGNPSSSEARGEVCQLHKSGLLVRVGHGVYVMAEKRAA